MSEKRKIIAVLFGGESVEHDVSILSGLQFLEAMDSELYEGFPVYVAPDGGWWTGRALLKRSFYPLTSEKQKELKKVHLEAGAGGKAGFGLKSMGKGLLGARETKIPFDLVVPAIHGTSGEDGSLQGLLAFLGIPFAGCSPLASSATMDKDFTKKLLAGIGIPVLPHALFERPLPGGALPTMGEIEAMVEEALGAVSYPLFVKPRALGSSIGAAKAEDADGLMAALLNAFRLDSAALIEPFVPSLKEYNIAVTRATGELRLSAIERPVHGADYLDFSEKYMAGGSGGPKLDEAPSEGMASLNRVLDPGELSAAQVTLIRAQASAAFEAFGLAGSVRVDFLSNATSGEFWLNEINTVPGSFAYFLWQAAEPELSFVDLTTAIIEEGFRLSQSRQAATDAGTGRAVIFDRG